MVKGARRGDPKWLLVRSATTVFGLPLVTVRRILRSVRLYPLPGARPELLGLIQHGGEPLAVLDLAAVALSGAAPSGAAPLVVVVSAGRPDQPEQAEMVGLAVDEALTVTAIAPRMISPHADGLDNLICGEAMVAGKMVRCLDLSVLAGRSR
jgi:chemotaxis signal transduction protein